MVATHVLAKVDSERLQRGVEGLASGAYAITLKRFTDDEVSAYVANGDGKTYSVTLTDGKAFYGCGDAMYRGKTCKHSVALALFVIRNPQEAGKEEQAEEQPIIMPKLAKTRPGWVFSA